MIMISVYSLEINYYYYYYRNTVLTLENGDTPANETRSITKDYTPGKIVGIGPLNESIYANISEGYEEGIFPEYSYATLPAYVSDVTNSQGIEDMDGYDNVACSMHSVHGVCHSHSLHKTISTSPFDGESPSLKRGLQTHSSKQDASTVEAEIHKEMYEEEGEQREHQGSPRNRLYNAQVASSSTIASPCALKSAVIPWQSREVASVKEKCIESFEKISSYCRPFTMIPLFDHSRRNKTRP